MLELIGKKHMKMDYEIGEIVKWMTGALECQGIVYEDLGEEVEVICRSIGGKECKTKLKIIKTILNKL